MKSKLVLCAVFCVFCSFCSGQWQEKTVYVPDSLCGSNCTGCIAYDSATNTVYVAGSFGDCVIAIDGATNRKIARMKAAGSQHALLQPDEQQGLLRGLRQRCYCDRRHQQSRHRYRARKWLPDALCYNVRDNRIYCASASSSTVAVIDGTSNQVLATVAVGRGPSALCYNVQDDKVYCTNQGDSTVTVIDCTSNEVLATDTVEESPLHFATTP